MKQNKGAILQASVDYINLLKDENEEFRHKDVKTQLKLQETEQEKKKLLLRIQVTQNDSSSVHYGHETLCNRNAFGKTGIRADLHHEWSCHPRRNFNMEITTGKNFKFDQRAHYKTGKFPILTTLMLLRVSFIMGT